MRGGAYMRRGEGVGYIRNGLSVSAYGRLTHGGGIYSDGLIFGGLRYLKCYVNDHQDKF